MPSAAKSGFGTTLTRAGYTIAELTKIGSPKLQLDTEDVTSHQSANGYKEYIGTILDAGDISIEGQFIPGDTNGQIGLVTDMNAKTLQDFVITFPTAVATTWTFKGLVTSFEIGEADLKGSLTFKASIKISGQPTLGITGSNNLSALVLTTATLYPSFAAGTYDYTATSTGASITVTPTASAGTITVNGNTVASGVPSGAISLGSINNVTTVTIVVTEANKMPKTYTIRVAKTA